MAVYEDNDTLKGKIAGLLRNNAPKWFLALLDHLRARKITEYDAKLRYKIRYDRNPMLTVFADKLAVREYAQSRLGDGFLPQVYGHGPVLDQAWFKSLPAEYVIKTNHGCGGIILVSASAPADAVLPEDIADGQWPVFGVRPENFNFENAKTITNKWLSQKFNDHLAIGKPFEWAYDNIVPQVFIEEMMHGEDGGVPPADYKLYCFNGKCQVILYIANRYNGLTMEFFDRNWKRIPAEFNKYNFAPVESQSPRPAELDQLIRVAESLATGVDQVRVDLYVTDKGVKLGELTNYSHAGNLEYKPRHFTNIIGKDWHPNYFGRRATNWK